MPGIGYRFDLLSLSHGIINWNNLGPSEHEAVTVEKCLVVMNHRIHLQTDKCANVCIFHHHNEVNFVRTSVIAH